MSAQVALYIAVALLFFLATAVIIVAALIRRPRRDWQVAVMGQTQDVRQIGVSSVRVSPVKPRHVSLEEMWVTNSVPHSAYVGVPRVPTKNIVVDALAPPAPEETAPYQGVFLVGNSVDPTVVPPPPLPAAPPASVERTSIIPEGWDEEEETLSLVVDAGSDPYPDTPTGVQPVLPARSGLLAGRKRSGKKKEKSKDQAKENKGEDQGTEQAGESANETLSVPPPPHRPAPPPPSASTEGDLSVWVGELGLDRSDYLASHRGTLWHEVTAEEDAGAGDSSA